MTPEQIRLLVQQYMSSTLQECEEHRASRVMDDEEREATWYGLTDVLEQTHGQLLRNYYTKITDVADELLQTHKIMLDKATEEYQRFCRELLKGRQAILKIELERNEGDYTGEVSHSGTTNGREPTRTLAPSKPFSEIVKVYFQEIHDSPAQIHRS
jgi:hypothetical protein